MKYILVMLSAFIVFCSQVQAAPLFSLKTLKEQAVKSVPKGANIVTESEDERGANVAYSVGETNFQFTLSTDKEPQVIPEEHITIKGHECIFFRPVGEESGGLFVPLKSKGSLAILVMNPMFSDNIVNVKDLKKIAKKIDLSLFE